MQQEYYEIFAVQNIYKSTLRQEKEKKSHPLEILGKYIHENISIKMLCEYQSGICPSGRILR